MIDVACGQCGGTGTVPLLEGNTVYKKERMILVTDRFDGKRLVSIKTTTYPWWRIRPKVKVERWEGDGLHWVNVRTGRKASPRKAAQINRIVYKMKGRDE